MAERVTKFAFFESFWDAASDLGDKDRLALYDAMCAYAFTGREPSFKGIMGTVWKLVKPNIDSSIKGQKTGGKGGRPTKGNPVAQDDKPPVSDNGNPPFSNTETPTETDMDMEKEMEGREFVPLERTNSLPDPSSGVAAAARAAPPAEEKEDESRSPHCPLCDSLLRFDVQAGQWRCACIGAVKRESVVWR